MKPQIELILPPKTCDLCPAPTAIALLQVTRNVSGEMLTGPFSQFSDGSKHRNLKPGLTFKGWLTYCAECFYTRRYDDMRIDHTDAINEKSP